MEWLVLEVPSRWDHAFVSPGISVKRTMVDDTRFTIDWQSTHKEVYEGGLRLRPSPDHCRLRFLINHGEDRETKIKTR